MIFQANRLLKNKVKATGITLYRPIVMGSVQYFFWRNVISPWQQNRSTTLGEENMMVDDCNEMMAKSYWSKGVFQVGTGLAQFLAIRGACNTICIFRQFDKWGIFSNQAFVHQVTSTCNNSISFFKYYSLSNVLTTLYEHKLCCHKR